MTEREAHKRRVLRVGSILHDFARGAMKESDALALLEEAGVSTGVACHMLETHRPRVRVVRPWSPSPGPQAPEPPRAA